MSKRKTWISVDSPDPPTLKIVVNDTQEESTVVLNATLCTSLGWSTNDLVTVSRPPFSLVLACRPLLSLRASTVSLSPVALLSLQAEVGDVLTVFEAAKNSVISPAESVFVHMDAGFGANFEFRELLCVEQLESRVLTPLSVVSVQFGAKTDRIFVHIDRVVPADSAVRITRKTKFIFADDENVAPDDATPLAVMPEIGGLREQRRRLQELVALPLTRRAQLDAWGVRPPAGVLLFGGPGTGKTLLARATAAEAGAHWWPISAPELVRSYVGESEAALQDAVEKALEHQPVIIFIDEIDAIAPQRDEQSTELERRLVGALLNVFDRIKGCDAVILAATNRRDVLDDALRRPGRFDAEVHVGAPNAGERTDILRVLLRDAASELSDAALESIAGDAHGFVGADLAALCREAANHALERVRDGKPLKLALNDLERALQRVRPASLRSVEVSVPHVKWEDIGGQETTKQRLQEAVDWPLRHAKAFEQMGIRPPRGVLLYGPPGCSKTLLAKALATESRFNFLAVKGPELLSKWVGESERAVRHVFRRARAAAPAVIFFDELDALAGARGEGDSGAADRVVSQLLVEMDGVRALRGVVVVAATNRPDLIDAALLRPGRIDRRVYVPPPDEAARLQILRIALKRTPHGLSDDDIEACAQQCEGFSGAEVVAVVREACLTALRESLDAKAVTKAHIESAIGSTTKQITTEMLDFYRRFNERG